MRRSDLLLLAGITAPHFNALVHRGRLPFKRRTGREERSWARFSVDDAYRLTLMVALTEAGLEQTRAGASVRADYDSLLNIAPEVPDGPLLFGVVQINETDEDGTGYGAGLPLIAALHELSTEIERICRVAGAPLRQVKWMLAIDARHVLRLMLKRARRHDVAVAELSALAARVRAT